VRHYQYQLALGVAENRHPPFAAGSLQTRSAPPIPASRIQVRRETKGSTSQNLRKQGSHDATQRVPASSNLSQLIPRQSCNDGARGAEIRFTSSILPKWARRTKSLDVLLPILHVRGVSTGDFQEAFAALSGKDAPNLSPALITRLTAEWQADYDAWHKRDLSSPGTAVYTALAPNRFKDFWRN
jgi:hypothetical protein